MPIEVKVLSFGDFLFYMELKLKEIIAPLLVKFCKMRVNILLSFIEYLKENMENPDLQPVVTNKAVLEELLNTKRILKHYYNKKS